MSNTLTVQLSSRKNEAGEYFEGTVSIVGLKPTKLARRSDGSTQFPNKSAVSSAARNLAKALGFTDVDVNDTTKVVAKVVKAKAPVAQVVKKAAKKSTPVTSTATTNSNKTSK